MTYAWDIRNLEHSEQKKIRRRYLKLKKDILLWDQQAAMAEPPFKQCQHLIKKFGGIMLFALAAGTHPEHIIRYWLASPYVGQPNVTDRRENHTRPTGGFIPSVCLPRIILMARAFGILITPQDLYVDFFGDQKAKVKDLQRWTKYIKKSDAAAQYEEALAFWA